MPLVIDSGQRGAMIDRASLSVVRSDGVWRMAVVLEAEPRQSDPTGYHHEEEHGCKDGTESHHVCSSKRAREIEALRIKSFVSFSTVVPCPR